MYLGLPNLSVVRLASNMGTFLGSVTGWTNSSWDTFSSTGDSFTASKDIAGGTDLCYSTDIFPVVNGKTYRIVLTVDSISASSVSVGLSSTTNVRSTTASISTTGLHSVDVTANVSSGNFSIMVSTTATGGVSINTVSITEL